jgi:hypothetical protein
VGAEGERGLGLPLEEGPGVPRLVALAFQSGLGEQLGQQLPGRPPLLSPAEPPGAAGVAGAPVELAQVGDYPRGVR